MNNPVVLEILEFQEKSEAGTLLTQYAAQAHLTEWMDEEEAREIEFLNGPHNDPQKPWQDKYETCDWLDTDAVVASPENRILSKLNSPSTSRMLRRKYRKQKSEARITLLHALNQEHQTFKGQMVAWLKDIHTLRELNTMADIAIGHDQRMFEQSGKVFCDTFQEMSSDFFRAEERIKRTKRNIIYPRAVVVDSFHFKPSKLRNGNSVAIATSQSEEDSLVERGYTVIARAR